MKVLITSRESQAIKNAVSWLKLLIDRDGDSEDGGHATMKEDKKSLERVIRKLQACRRPTD